MAMVRSLEAIESSHPHNITGYWSSGTRLADSARISGDGIKVADFPEYMVRFTTFSKRFD
jgi:hypothetical protein